MSILYLPETHNTDIQNLFTCRAAKTKSCEFTKSIKTVLHLHNTETDIQNSALLVVSSKVQNLIFKWNFSGQIESHFAAGKPVFKMQGGQYCNPHREKVSSSYKNIMTLCHKQWNGQQKRSKWRINEISYQLGGLINWLGWLWCTHPCYILLYKLKYQNTLRYLTWMLAVVRKIYFPGTNTPEEAEETYQHGALLNSVIKSICLSFTVLSKIS